MGQSFGTARFVITILELLGWVTVAGAGIVAIVVFGQGTPQLEGFAIMLGIAIVGLLQIVAAQVTKALIVTAENTSEMVGLLKASEKASRAKSAPAEGAVPALKKPSPTAPGVYKVYKGREIHRTEKGFSVEGVPFYNVHTAEKYIDKIDG